LSSPRIEADRPALLTTWFATKFASLTGAAAARRLGEDHGSHWTAPGHRLATAMRARPHSPVAQIRPEQVKRAVSFFEPKATRMLGG